MDGFTFNQNGLESFEGLTQEEEAELAETVAALREGGDDE